MITLNNTTQNAKFYVQRYLDADCTSVDNFYKHCSDTKRQAEQRIKDRMYHADGHAYGYYILGGSCMQFTAGYILHSNEDHRHYLIVETAYNTYKIDVEGIFE